MSQQYPDPYAGRQPQQPYHGYPQQYQQPYYQAPPPPPPPQRVRHVETQRGLGGLSNTVHLVLTVFTCGAWLFVWIPWWIFRMVVPRKTVHRYYYR